MELLKELFWEEYNEETNSKKVITALLIFYIFVLFLTFLYVQILNITL